MEPMNLNSINVKFLADGPDAGRPYMSIAMNLEASLAPASLVSQPDRDRDISHHVTEEFVPSPTPVENAPTRSQSLSKMMR